MTEPTDRMEIGRYELASLTSKPGFLMIGVMRTCLNSNGISDVVRRGRLHWFGHVEHKTEQDWAKKVLRFEVDGKRLRGRPRKIWMKAIKMTVEV